MLRRTGGPPTSCSCRPGRSCSPASGRRRCPTWPATSGSITFDGRGSGASGPAGRRGGVRRRRVRRRRPRRAGRHRHRRGRRWSALSCGASGRCTWPPATPTGCAGCSRSRRRCGFGVPDPGRDECSLATTRLDDHEGWAKYNRHYWLRAATTTTSCGSSSARCSPSRTRPSRSRTASAGPRDRPRRPWSTPPPAGSGCDGAVCTPLEPLCRAGALPGAGHARHRRRDRGRTRSAQRLAELTGGHLRAGRGRRPRAARPRPGAGQPR